MNEYDEISLAYLHTFEESPYGRKVLKDFERIANSTSVDKKDPNPYAAIYRVAQQQFVNEIKNRIERAKNNGS